MGRLRTLTILMSIGAWGAASHGAYQEGAPSPAPASRPPAPAPPVEYLRAGAMLFNNGQYDLAAKYLKAAHDYRDELTEAEQARLDEYFQAMDVVNGPGRPGRPRPRPTAARSPRLPSRPTAAAPADRPGPRRPTDGPRPGAGVADRPGAGRRPARAADYPTDRSRRPAGCSSRPARTSPGASTTSAQAKIDAVRMMDVRWGLFDEVTPNKLQKELDKARPAGAAAAAAASVASPPRHRATPASRRSSAKDRLAEARDGDRPRRL